MIRPIAMVYIRYTHTLKTESRHDANFAVRGGTGGWKLPVSQKYAHGIVVLCFVSIQMTVLWIMWLIYPSISGSFH